MKRTIALFHATMNAVEPIVSELRRQDPEADIRNYVDEGALLLPADRGRQGLEESAQRILDWLSVAKRDGAEGILLSCSIATPMAPAFEAELSIPVVPIDRAMIIEAADQATRIGLLATLDQAAETTQSALLVRAEEIGRSISVQVRVVSEALQALKNGDAPGHDQMILQAVREIGKESEIVILAQVSMARAVEGALNLPCPVLTSARSAVSSLLQRIG